MEIGFNSKFLVDMLNNLSAEEVNLELRPPTVRASFAPASLRSPEDVLMLVMPVSLALIATWSQGVLTLQWGH